MVETIQSVHIVDELSGSSDAAGELSPQQKQAALHELGRCNPCRYMQSRGCRKGDRCCYCHSTHSAEAKQRPHTTTRARCQRQAAELDLAQREDPIRFRLLVVQFSAQGEHMRGLMQARKLMAPLWHHGTIAPRAPPPKTKTKQKERKDKSKVQNGKYPTGNLSFEGVKRAWGA